MATGLVLSIVLFMALEYLNGLQIQTLLGKDLEEFQTRKDDVFVVSYPKSGTTFVREVLWQIFHDGATSDEHLGKRVFFFDSLPLLNMNTTGRTSEPARESTSIKPVVDLLPSPRLLVSHLPYDIITKCKDNAASCKFIYISRNAKDVAVSYFHFLTKLSGEMATKLSFEMFLKYFLQGKFAYNSWLDHVLGWWKQRHNPNVLFFKYEDMKKDLPTSIKAMAEFLEKPLTEEVIQRIAHQCSFAEMVKNPASYQVFPGNDDIRFLRKGEIGDWKNHFTSDMNEQVETEFVAKLKEYGLEFDYC